MIAFAEKKITYDQFREMEIPDGDTSIYELINGEIMKRASPNSPHQRLSTRLVRMLDNFVQEKQTGEIFHAPMDVVLDDENVPQPDIFFISKERNHIIDPDGPITGAPDLIIEILSKSTVMLDKGVKKDLYERFQVKEYWLADPVRKSIEVYALVGGRYKMTGYAEGEGSLQSSILIGLELDIELLFA